MLLRIVVGVFIYTCCQTGFAHKSSDSYLTLKLSENRIKGQWDIALRDLDFAIGLDANGDGAITWGELRGRRDAVITYAFNRLGLDDGKSACRLIPGQFLVDNHSDGAYSVMQFAADCKGRLRNSASTIRCSSISIHSTGDCCASTTRMIHVPPCLVRPAANSELNLPIANPERPFCNT